MTSLGARCAALATLLALGACQALSGVGDLEFVDTPDGSAGQGGSAGGTGGTAGAAGSAGSGGASGSAGAAGAAGSGGAPPCADASQCPGVDDECGTRTCESGTCGIDPTPQGTAIAAQTDGDCKRQVCDGQGGVEEENDDQDVPDDGKECTNDTCEQGVPKHDNASINTPCGGGSNTKCDGAGNCVGCTQESDCPADTACLGWSCNTNTQTCVQSAMSQATPCGPQPNCNNGVAELQDHCNGQGACQDAGSQPCAPYVCGAAACATSCNPADKDSCATGYYCDGSTGGATCSPKLGNGQQCSSADQCSSGHCVDGVCCENACTGLCRACSSVKQGGGVDGLCLKVANFTDPDSECAGGRVCNDNFTAPGCTGVQQCNCSTPVFNQYQNCCSACGQAECPSQINACNAQHGTYCTAIGNVDVYGAGQGVTDTNCPSGKRCGGLACTCVQ